MYRAALLFSILFFCIALPAQDSLQLQRGSRAPGFTLSMKDNTSRSITFPNQKKLMLVHFWNSDPRARQITRQLRSIAERYKNCMYKSAEGFEVIAIAVKTDKLLWKEALWTDSLGVFANGTARDYTDDVCKKYAVTTVPRDVLMDENGVVIAMDPSMKELEGLLSERKVFQPVKKDLMGLLAHSLNRDDVLKGGKLSLYTAYGDSIANASCSANGKFTFSYVKLNQDVILKIANQSEMDVSDPIALYSPSGEFLMNGVASDGYCVFSIPYKMMYRLLDGNAASTPNEQMNLVANMEFSKTGTFQLSAKDEEDLNAITQILMKNKSLNIEFKTHTDSKLTDAGAMDLTTRQVQLIKNYFQKKGIVASRIKGIPKGKSDLSKRCPDNKCGEEEHRLNRRVEFVIS